MKRVAVTVLSLLLPLALSACGEDASTIGADASSRLGPQVQQLRDAASNGDRETAVATLADIRATVAEMGEGGELSDGEVAGVLAAAAEVEAQLGLITTTTTATTVPPPPVTSPVQNDRDDDSGRGKRGKNDDD